MDANELQLLGGMAAVPIIVGLVQAVKGYVTDERAWPPLAVGLGVAWNVAVAAALAEPLPVAALVGAVVGLAAAGLYSGVRTLRG